jgi:isopentenyl-diphosphate delta-isomerase
MESVRARKSGDTRTASLGQLFRDWGIPTPIALVEAREGATGLPIIATGGVRSGLDAARALGLGAGLVGVGFPFLKAAADGEAALREFLEQFLVELKVAMQLSGAGTLEQLRAAPVVVTGATREWLEQRGFGGQLRALAKRGRARLS